MTGRLRQLYGSSQLHLLAVVVTMTFAVYGAVRIAQGPDALNTFIWLGGAIIAHDLISFPLYSALNLIAHRALVGPLRSPGIERKVPLINHIRIPAILSGFALVAWFPLILRLSADDYRLKSGLDADVFLERWLLITAALFLGSALIYAVRLRRATLSAPGGAGSE
jgi:hypothetical protein